MISSPWSIRTRASDVGEPIDCVASEKISSAPRGVPRDARPSSAEWGLFIWNPPASHHSAQLVLGAMPWQQPLRSCRAAMRSPCILNLGLHVNTARLAAVRAGAEARSDQPDT